MPATSFDPFDLTPPTPLLTSIGLSAVCRVCGRPSRPLNHIGQDPHAVCRSRMAAERKARVAAALEVAAAEWRTLCERFSDSPAVVAVLDLHQPSEGYSGVICAHCLTDCYDDTESVSWTCETYAAVRDADADGG